MVIVALSEQQSTGQHRDGIDLEAWPVRSKELQDETFRYYFMLNCLATLIYAMKHLFNTLVAHQICISNELGLELQETYGVSIST